MFIIQLSFYLTFISPIARHVVGHGPQLNWFPILTLRQRQPLWLMVTPLLAGSAYPTMNQWKGLLDWCSCLKVEKLWRAITTTKFLVGSRISHPRPFFFFSLQEGPGIRAQLLFSTMPSIPPKAGSHKYSPVKSWHKDVCLRVGFLENLT